MLMPRFQIFVLQGAEMANFFKKCKRKFEFFEQKFKILSCFDLTDFYITFIALQRKF